MLKKEQNNINVSIKQRSLFMEFILGGFSTSCACVFSNPMEVIKSRMQVQGELGSKTRAFKNTFHAGYTIIRNEGIRGIQSGLTPGIVYQIFMNGARLGSFGPLKRYFNVQPNEALFLPKIIMCGAMAGTLGASIGSPFFLVKVRLQTQVKYGDTIPLGTQHKYDGMLDAYKQIFREEGVLGFWRGCTSGIFRVTCGSAAQLSSYDFIKNYLSQFEILNPNGDGKSNRMVIASGFVSGFFVCTFMNPGDVIATRLYNQKLGEKYHGLFNCAKMIYKTEGIFAFFKGWLAHWTRIGPHTILTFFFWEHFKSVANRHGY